MMHKLLGRKKAAGKFHVAEKSLDLRLQWGNAWSKLADQQDCEVIFTSHPRKVEFFHLLPPHLSISAWPQAPSKSSCLVPEDCRRIKTEAKESSVSLKHFVLWMWSLQQQPIYWGTYWGRWALCSAGRLHLPGESSHRMPPMQCPNDCPCKW